jgi:hypothetical protein
MAADESSVPPVRLADPLASLPFPQVKILRVFRLIRVTRLLRQTPSGTSS